MNTKKAKLNELSAEKLKVLVAELNRAKTASRPAIKRRAPGQAVFPLSFAQERVWFFDQIFPGTAVYNWPFAVSFNHALDHLETRGILKSLVERHEILRTTYRLVENKPMQHVAAPGDVHLEYIDLSAAADPSARARELIEADTRRGFDLENGPLYRFFLFHISSTASIFAGTFHHSVVDAWSRKVLFKDWSALAELARTRSRAALPPLPLQYGDYAVWQRDMAASAKTAPMLEYWKRELADLHMADLPSDRPRPTAVSFKCGTVDLEIAPALSQALRSLAQAQGTTLFAALLSGFMMLLQRYSGSDDVATAIPVSNRNRSELEGLIGFFVNTLIIRADLGGSPTFRELLTLMRGKVLNALGNQDVPFEQLVEVMKPKRELNRNPFTTFMFQLEEIPSRSAQERQAEMNLSLGLTPFDLEIHLYDERSGMAGEMAGGVRGVLTYSAELFDVGTIRQIIRSYLTLLEGVVRDPDAVIGDIPVVSESDAARFLPPTDGAHEPPAFTALCETISRQAARRGGAVAIEGAGPTLTYAELEREVNQIASYLRSKGVGRGSLVALSVDRSSRMVAALLGILKSGAAYVPLDPGYPVDRLQSMIDDSAPALLLTSERYRQRLRIEPSRELCLDSQWDEICRAVPQQRFPQTMSLDIAYVIYTSGSSGKPKGVEVTHRGLANVIASMRDECRIDESDVWLAVTSMSFDIAALEVFLPLSVGGRTVLATRNEVLDPERLGDLIRGHEVSVMQATPATWQMMTLDPSLLENRSMKIICGGESLPADLARRLLAASDFVWNAYGPTETTIWSSLQRVTAAPGPVPIGKPLARTQLHILDDNLQLVPVGVEGDLYISGDGLARGYRGQPLLTAEKFLPNPFGKTGGERMYHTGDRARYRPDGSVVYLGRIDNQVKIRGYRVEVEEIEACLLDYPPILQAAVQAVLGRDEHRRLVAYYKLKDADAVISSDALAEHARRHLPEYMVPAVFKCLAEWPLTPNGKLDRRALPSLGEDAFIAKPFEEPRDAVERSIAGIWADMLKRPRIGRQDNFFELGGDSLASVQMVYSAREQGIQLRPSDVFQHQSLAALAAAAKQNSGYSDAALAREAPGNLIELTPGTGERSAAGKTLFLVHPAGGDVMCYHALASHIDSRCAVVGIAFDMLPKSLAEFVPVETLAARYLTALRSRQPEGPYHLGGWSFGGLVAFEMARQLAASGVEAESLFIIDQAAPLANDVAPAEGTSLRDIVRKIELFTGRELDIREAELDGMSEDVTLEFILARMKQKGLFPDYVVPAAFKNFIKAYDQHIQAAASYTPGRYDGPLTVLRATDKLPDHMTVPGDTADAALGWQRFCEAPVQVHPVGGHHLSVVSPAHAPGLAETINAVLKIDPAREIDLVD
jgi:amino acid adenylation domain-containing protein